MSSFWATRKDDHLVPVPSAENMAEFSKLPYGKEVLVEARQPRNAGHHKLFWVLCTRIGSSIGQPADVVADILKVATGHATTVKLKSLGWQRFPKSISFAKMDQTQFSEFFEACLKVIYTEFGIARPEILEAIGDLLTPQESHLKERA
jgi:hypothetical protein